ncbi:hypothetical protein C350_02014 [Cryptococcus neoformans MW-RSA36]|nr:hypothetical protein C350_02014 [Cryptococcus neoformans var. grubii MW-RSA36]
MTISVTNKPAKPPARHTHICINPFLTSQPSLAANFRSTKVVDAPVSTVSGDWNGYGEQRMEQSAKLVSPAVRSVSTSVLLAEDFTDVVAHQ